MTGQWYYNSGSWHADWATLGIPVVDEAGNVVDQGAALMPISELERQETWFVAGMRASGSNSLIAMTCSCRITVFSRCLPRSAASIPASPWPTSRSTARPSCRCWP